MKPRKDKPAVVDSTSSLALMTGRKNYQVEVRDIGVFEWLPTGTANGTDVFAGSSGYWSKILTSDSGSTYSPLTIVDVSASRDLLITDAGKVLLVNSGSPITITVPAEGDVEFEIGTEILIIQTGAGQVSIDGTAVEFWSKDSLTALTGQFSAATLIRNQSDGWILIGDLSA